MSQISNPSLELQESNCKILCTFTYFRDNKNFIELEGKKWRSISYFIDAQREFAFKLKIILASIQHFT